MLTIFQILVLIFSAVIHEYMHGWMAYQLGDPTAKNSGRLTINPLKHLDLYGSLVVPAFLVILKAGFVFAWAKPVPFNPYFLRDKKYGPAKVALAGPMGNFIIALIFGLLLRFFGGFFAGLNPALINLLIIIVMINLMLMVFNLVPIPPMDGSKVIMPFLPYRLQVKYAQLEQYGLLMVLFFVAFAFNIILPIVWFLFKIITGIS